MQSEIAAVNANDQAILDSMLGSLGTEAEVVDMLADLALEAGDIIGPEMPKGDGADAAVIGESTMQAAMPALPCSGQWHRSGPRDPQADRLHLASAPDS